MVLRMINLADYLGMRSDLQDNIYDVVVSTFITSLASGDSPGVAQNNAKKSAGLNHTAAYYICMKSKEIEMLRLSHKNESYRLRQGLAPLGVERDRKMSKLQM